jgi:hypothetical protein
MFITLVQFCLLYVSSCLVLALAVVPVISIAVQKSGRYLRELSHSTQAAAAMAASIAEVCEQNMNFILEFIYFEMLNSWYWEPCIFDITNFFVA